ncbi:MAG: DUF1707 SHOCT-like domain-containing protein [Acidimicrobiales bacterium]
MGTHGEDPGAALRVSDSEREAVANALREHCGEGRLSLDELSERLEATFAARTREELDRVLLDLPKSTSVAGIAIGRPAQGAGGLVGGAGGPARRRSTGWTISVMSDNSHRGRWRPKAVTNVIALMGTCELDLRQAEIDGSEVVINAFSLMGHIEVVVPEGIEVSLTGIPIMGCKYLQIRPVPPIPGAPTVRVRGFMLMGDLMVRSRAGHGDSGDHYSEVVPGPSGPGWEGSAVGRGFGGADRAELRYERHARRRERRRRR